MVCAVNNNSFSSRTCKQHKIGIFLNTSKITESTIYILHCVSKKGPTLKRYSSKLYGSILMIFGRNIQKSLE